MRITGPLTLLLTLGLGVTSCGSNDDDGSSDLAPLASAARSTTTAPSVAATPSDNPSESPSSRPTVSDRTTCDLLFNGREKNALSIILDFVNRPSNTIQQANATDDAIEELRAVALSAGDNLAAQLNAEADAAQVILDGARVGSDEAYDTTALRAAGLEIANTCQGSY